MSRNLFSIFKKRNNHTNAFATAANSYSSSFGTPYSAPAASSSKRRLNFGLRGFRPSKQLSAVLVIGVIAVLGFAFWFKNASENIQSGVLGTSNGSSTEIAAPYATKQIDRELSFPLRNEKGDKVAEFKYIIQNAELTREIVVKGQKATAVKGRAFLVLNLKVNNDAKQKIQVNTKDYLRITVNGQDTELLAPDIHNDPVEVQPISTKFTRVGFAIDDTTQNIKLQVGEIEGEKQYVDLNF